MSDRILIATDDDDAYRHFQEMLIEAGDSVFSQERTYSLSTTVERVQQNGLDAVLLDLTLPGSHELEGFRQVFGAAPQLPVVLLCSPVGEPMARLAIHEGAYGYLLKHRNAGYLLIQTLQSMILQGRLSMSRARAQVTLDSIGDAVIGTDAQGRVEYLNKAAEKLTGWCLAEALGQSIERVMPLVGGSAEQQVPSPVDLALAEGHPVSASIGVSLLRRDGTQVAVEDSVAPIREADGGIVGAVVVFHDVTQARAAASRMAFLAQHDSLTGLPNRVMLKDRMAQAISLARRNEGSVALLFLDLDHFKHINDSLGHANGDRLLQSVARRLSNCVRDSDTVSRNGGDEFVVLLAEGNNHHSASIAAEKILLSMGRVHRVDGHALRVTTSIGISVFPDDALDAETLLKHADIAMYHAKQSGKNVYRVFSQAMDQGTEAPGQTGDGLSP